MVNGALIPGLQKGDNTMSTAEQVARENAGSVIAEEGAGIIQAALLIQLGRVKDGKEIIQKAVAQISEIVATVLDET